MSQQGPGYFASPPYDPVPRTSGEATASLVLGICGLIVCPLFPSIPAVVIGNSARRAIDESQGTLTGRGLAVTGIILGWLGIALSLIGIVVLIALIAADSG